MNTLEDFEKTFAMLLKLPDPRTKQRLLEPLIENMAHQVPEQLRPLWNVLFIESETRASARMRALGEVVRTGYSLTGAQAAQAVEEIKRQ